MKNSIIFLWLVLAIAASSCAENKIAGTVTVSFKCTDDENKLPATIDATVKSKLHFTDNQSIGDSKTITLNRNGFTYSGNYKLSAGKIRGATPTHWDTPVIENDVCAKVECDAGEMRCIKTLSTIPRIIPYTNPAEYDISHNCECR